MEPNQEKWVNDILNSLDGVQRAEPSPFLFAKIRNRLSKTPAPIYVSERVAWLTAASFALLFLLNYQVINPLAWPTAHQTSELNTVVSDMLLFPASNQLYDNLWSEQNY